MKNLITAALLFITITASAFTPDPGNINAAALRNFEIEFQNASNVVWTERREYIKASFMLGKEKMEAIFNFDGDIIATCKSISLDDLPVKAKRNFAKKLDGYTVTEAIRFEGVDEGAFYISAENQKEAVVVKVADTNHVSVFKKTKK